MKNKAKNKQERLKEGVTTFRYLSAGLLGGAMFSNENSLTQGVLCILAGFSMWSAHQLNGQISSISRCIIALEENDDTNRTEALEEDLHYIMTASFISIILP
jgi:hypothetical protein